MENINVGIIGLGFVGNAVYHTFSPYFKMRLHDKYKPGMETLQDVVDNCRYLFLCLPTPVDINSGKQDLSIILSMVETINFTSKENKVLIIRSTILPGTTKKLAEKYPKLSFVFCPEFLTERTAILDSINAYRVILGGDNSNILDEVESKIFRIRYVHAPIFKTSFEAAELVKYVGNCYFSVKISFLNEVYEICKRMGIEYNEIKKLFLSDMRVCNSHMDVPGPDGDLGFGGKCFIKDLKSLENFGKDDLNLKMDMLEAANKVNERVRTKKDWLKIKGATTENNYD